MSNVGEVRWRLLCEQLAQVYRQADLLECETLPAGLPPERNAEILLRLAGAALTLLDSHAVDGKGRCRARMCARRSCTLWRGRRCQVFVTIHFWIQQPLGVVKKASGRW